MLRHTAVVLAALLGALAVGPAAGAGPESSPVVLGIVLREVGPAFAVIQDPATSRTGFYRVGARLGDTVVTAILADRVILGDGQRQLRLATPVSSGPSPAGVAPTTPRDPLAPAGRPARAGVADGVAPASPYGHIAAVAAAAAGAGGDDGRGGESASLAGLAGQVGGGGGSSSGAQNGLGAAISFTGRLHDGTSLHADEFSAPALRDLLIATTFTGAAGQQQRLELYAPDGSLYQRLTGAVAPSTQTVVPVGGTWITEHALVGGWRAEVYIDRETTPIVSRTFALTQ